MTKVGRFSHANRDDANGIATYYGKSDELVEELATCGKLNLHGVLDKESHEDLSEDTCALTCGRPSAYASPLSVHGLVGFVCVPHGIPLRGAFVDMTTPEQFAYYLVTLGQMYASGLKIDVSWNH